MGKYNRRQFLGYTGAVLGTSLLLKACGNSKSTEKSTTDATTLKVAMVLPGIITDKAWNQAGYSGLEVIREKQDADTTYVERVGQAEQVEALSDFARRGYNLIYAHGGQFDAAIEQVAADFPETFFVGVNGAIAGENYASLRINSLQAGYVCGVIGALVTKSKQMAYISAQKFESTQQELKGFEMGAKSINPDIKVRSTFTGDWNDAAKAKEATLALISTGVDVIYQWLDNASPAVLQTASEKGVYAIGNTTDQLKLAPDAVLTSAVKRIDLAVAYLAQLQAKGELKGEVYTIGFDQPEILYLGKFGEKIPAEVKEKAMEIKQAIVEQTIKLT
ncbi:MAG: BMP family ABC transporter substrate-binding protein [Symploca sp. SIO1C4]|uniref:BMP family ABC transporter substrate-binding protein n=1 Tax=Symploca sp. SIO1C4 TaxID=2607765 RepID=A0A6B3N7F5_9CYAN|nr:BMP family ABC transporter substrate-binding protein [Symploca sp. SIO1C4]